MTVTDREPAAATDAATSSPGRLRARPSARPSTRRKNAAPAARFQPGRAAETRHRNPAWLLAGVLLVVLSALGGVLLFLSRDDRIEVLVITRTLQPGEPIQRSDLRIERIAADGALDTISPAGVDELVGQFAVGLVPEGTLLNPALFSVDSGLGADEMDIGAALDPGEFPRSDVDVGASVELLVAPRPDLAAGDAAVAVDRAEPIGTGTVTRAEERATGQLLLTMRVTRDVGLVATQAAQEDTLRVVLVGDGS